MKRNVALQSIRPSIEQAKILEETGMLEAFQNQTLRPILKFQHDILVELVAAKTAKYKLDLEKQSILDQQKYYENLIRKKLRDQLLGIVIGHFTIPEFQTYRSQESELNRRITNMICKRVIGSLV